MKIVPILVAYHSAHWLGVAIESYLEHFPGDRLLVVDNNPRRGEIGWAPECTRERAWLASHPSVLLIDNPAPPDGLLNNRTHGAAMDVALDWARAQGADVLLHLEPDCLVTGRQWRENLLAALDAGAWMAGGYRQCHGPIHPTPSAWRIADVKASFKITPWKGRDELHPRFHELVDVESLKNDNSPMGIWIGWTRHWDTGHKAWFEAALHSRAALVETPGFKHYWHGSQERRYSPATLAQLFPEVLPYLNAARERRQNRPIEECAFRHAVAARGMSEFARCRLLQDISGVTAEDACLVHRDACRACSESWAPSVDEPNPVVASLLYELADRVIDQHGMPGCTANKASKLKELAETNLDVEWP